MLVLLGFTRYPLPFLQTKGVDGPASNDDDASETGGGGNGNDGDGGDGDDMFDTSIGAGGTATSDRVGGADDPSADSAAHRGARALLDKLQFYVDKVDALQRAIDYLTLLRSVTAMHTAAVAALDRRSARLSDDPAPGSAGNSAADRASTSSNNREFLVFFITVVSLCDCLRRSQYHRGTRGSIQNCPLLCLFYDSFDVRGSLDRGTPRRCGGGGGGRCGGSH